MAKPVTRIIDKGFNKIQKEIQKMKGCYVTIGIHDNAGKYPNDDVTVAEVAFWNEYGTRTIPARPFVGGTALAKEKIFNAVAKREFQRVIALLSTVERGLNTLGTRIREEIKNTILTAPNSIIVKNADLTVKLKTMGRHDGKTGTAKPLFDSGLLFRSIGYQITVRKVKGQVER